MARICIRRGRCGGLGGEGEGGVGHYGEGVGLGVVDLGYEGVQ